eukprot:scaffold15986_cov116-Cylindrotheca_fusiformis.AAC.2
MMIDSPFFCIERWSRVALSTPKIQKEEELAATILTDRLCLRDRIAAESSLRQAMAVFILAAAQSIRRSKTLSHVKQHSIGTDQLNAVKN